MSIQMEMLKVSSGVLHQLEEGTLGDIFVALDLGSTQTRSVVFDLDGVFSEPILIDSSYAVLNQDISSIRSKDESIENNLEITLVDETANVKTDPFFDTVTILKGGLRQVCGIDDTVRTTANASKIDQEATYINAIANIAIDLLLTSVSTQVLPIEPVNVDLSTSLPPEDTTINVRVSSFIDRIAGTYTAKFNRLGISLRFNIDSRRVTIVSESNAVAFAFSVDHADDMDDEATYGFIDVGGRSAGYCFIRNGTLIEGGCSTAPVGGSNMLTRIGSEMSAVYNIAQPDRNVVLAGLPTGLMRFGTRKLSMADAVNRAKSSIAEEILQGFLRCMDDNHITAQILDTVYCSGRTFGISRGEDAIVSPSMVEFIAEKFKSRSQYTRFELLDSDNPILRGIRYFRVSKGM